MKYAKELNTSIQKLPVSLQETCVNYKLWKKRCKSMQLQEAIVLLKSECDMVESIFTSNYKNWSHPPLPIFTCFCNTRVVPLDANLLLFYAETNAKTVYKVCKRLQKMTNDMTPMNWLTSVRASHVFGFLGGHHTAHLQLKQHGECLECPICVNEVQNNVMLIYQCGHHACLSCALQYAKVSGNGLWYNVLMYAQKRDCPYCRYDKALCHVSTV